MKLNVLHLHLTDDQGWRIRDRLVARAHGRRRLHLGGRRRRRLLHEGRLPPHRRVRRRAVHHDRARDRPARAHERGAQRLPRAELRRGRTRTVRGHRGRLLVALRLARAGRGDRPVPGRRHPRARRAHARAVAAPRRRRVAVDEPRRLPRPRAADDAGRRRDRQDDHRMARDGRLARAARRHGRAVLELRRARGRRGRAHPLVRGAGRQRHPLARRRRLPRHEVRRRSAERARPHARPRLGEGADHDRRGVPLGAVVDRARRRRAATSSASRRRSGPRRSPRSRMSSSWRSRASTAIAEIGWSPAPAAGDSRDTEAFFGRVATLGAHWDAAGIAYYPVRGVPWRE